MLPFSDDDLKPAVISVIEKIRPSIQADGGDIKLIDIIDGKVFVQLRGACIGCASSGMTIKYGVEKQLKEMIHPDIVAINVPLGWEDKLDKLG